MAEPHDGTRSVARPSHRRAVPRDHHHRVTRDISDHGLLEETFRLAVEACPNGMVIIDDDGKIIMANSEIELQFGYRREELIGLSVNMLVPARLRGAHTSQRGAFDRDTSARPREVRADLFGLRRDGSEFAIEVGLTPIPTGSGPSLVLGVIVDVSERKNAETHLAQMESKYRGLLEAAPDAMVVVNSSGEIVLLNVQAEKQFGYRRDELLGQKVTNIIPVGFAERLIADETRSTEDALAQQIGAGIELIGHRKDGSEFPIEIMLSPLDTAEGTLVTAAIRDISLRKNSEQHLAQMESKYRGLLEAAPDAMVVVNQAGEIVLLNLQAEKRFGYRRDELLGQKVTNIIPEGFSERLLADALRSEEDALAQQIGTGIELHGRRKDASEFPIEIMLSPLESAEGTLVTAAIRDISVRKRVERLKDEFVSTVSHEMRTPMTSISGSLSLLVDQWASMLPGSADRLLAIAHKNSQRLVRLVNDILDIEKLEAGRVVFNLSSVDILPLVKQTIEANRGFAHGYGVRVLLDATSVDGEVSADPDRLAQVITNLLSNAIKFSPPDDEVRISVQKNGAMVRILVRDSGCGIPAEFKPHIFEKFAQADATSSKQKGGTGLGLSIVKQIVERLHGDVGFDDAPGGGTIFYVDLPAWDGAPAWDIDLDAVPDAPRILLCEDERETAIAMRDGLRQAGFAADLAFTVAAAQARADANQYSAFMVDLHLPDGDGISLILSLRAMPQYRDTPIIVVSMDPIRGSDDVRALTLNVLGWLSKPVDFVQLVRTLKELIATPEMLSWRSLRTVNSKAQST